MKGFVLVTTVFMSLTAGPATLAAPREPVQEEVADKIDLQELNRELENLEIEIANALEGLDVEAQIRESMEAARAAIENSRLQHEAAVKILEEIDIDQIVRQALEGARLALENVDIEAAVQAKLQETDVDAIVSKALREAQEALRDLDLDKEIRKALKEAQVDVERAEPED